MIRLILFILLSCRRGGNDYSNEYRLPNCSDDSEKREHKMEFAQYLPGHFTGGAVVQKYIDRHYDTVVV